MRFGTYELPNDLKDYGMQPLEQGGILLGSGASIGYFTTPGPLDYCAPDSFVMLDDCHQQALTESGLDYLGFWHSHPVGTPSEPSPEDLESWQQIAQTMLEQQPHVKSLLFPIVTGDVLRVWTLTRSLELTELQGGDSNEPK